MTFLQGYLTYLSGIAFIVVGIIQYLQGEYGTGVQNILGGVAIIGGRRAIGKIIIEEEGERKCGPSSSS